MGAEHMTPTRMGISLAIGLSLIAVAAWLSGAVLARGADRAPSLDAAEVVALPGSSVQPQAMSVIPYSRAAAIIDGHCTDDYGDAFSDTFTDVAGVKGTVYLKHDISYLYVCMVGAAGTLRDRFASVYLDTNDDKAAVAQADDYSLRVQIVDGTTSSWKGDGAGGYVAATLPGWSAAASTSPNNDSAEWKIPIALTGGGCDQDFGLAVHHQDVDATGDDFGWPANSVYNKPITWQEVSLGSFPCGQGRIAYVFRIDTATAGNFKTLLESQGYAPTLILLSTVTAPTQFANYEMIIVADDTGSLDNWGSSAAQVGAIAGAGKPILGLGEGGYAFFGKLGSGIGWPHGWHGPLDSVYGLNVPSYYVRMPFNFTSMVPGTFPLYSNPVNEVGIYFGNNSNPGVYPIGLEPPYPTGQLADHAPLIAETGPVGEVLLPSPCRQLWGYSGGPVAMNSLGSRLFLNAVGFGLDGQKLCAPPPPPPACVTVEKSAIPAAGATVHPGDVISYTLKYHLSDVANCVANRASLVDPIPMDTLYVPNSATDGGIPVAGTLVWNLGNLAPGATGQESFTVYVLDRQCHDQRRVNNIGRLNSSLGVFSSNLVSHPVECPPVTFPNTQAPYAEDDIQIYPYPLVTGTPSQLSVRVRNLLNATQVVSVSFQTSPNRFGIGLNYSDLPIAGNPRVVTLPPLGTVVVTASWTPVSSGHYCLQVKVEGSGFAPIYTQHNLDVQEDLRPGVPDHLVFNVGNPTASPADILLVVDNTCPGWVATVSPTLLVNVGANDSDIRTATLTVIPPFGPPLGTACHIDVQGWIGGKLIGGIRKLDVPPVNLPPGNPSWEEPEISIAPNPPTVGLPAQFCVQLQNPLSIPRTVVVIYSYADFGAGIGITPIATRTLTLPAFSNNQYCISWTPSPSGTLHRCLFITLQQSGFQDQRSQHNINLVRPLVRPSGLPILFFVGNPGLYTRTLTFVPQLVGLDPTALVPQITPDPPPDGLGPGQVMQFQLELMPGMMASGAGPAAPAVNYGFGDASSAEVGVYLDQELVGGVTVEFGPPVAIFLPNVLRQ
jgi:uncharacterized repeat protein (TIGR01451 family)